jgi:hypothetical protein
VWDPDNALTLCNGCHSSHHNRGALVVPLSALRDENYAFAVALMGAGPAYEYLRRRYAGNDTRLDALLELDAERVAREAHGDVPLDRTYGEGS